MAPQGQDLVVSRRGWIITCLAAVGLVGFVYYFLLGGSGRVTALQVRMHPESSLTYPNSYLANSDQRDEDDSPGWPLFNNGTPVPAMAETQFYTPSKVVEVIAWYQQQLSVRGWHDVVPQGIGSRYWDRGANEEFYVSCGHQHGSADLWCDVQYHLLSPRFHQELAPAPDLGDPVEQAAVQARQVGLSPLGASPADPRDGTPAADAARSTWPRWPRNGCCGPPVILLDRSAVQAPSSAYHVVTVQSTEYDDLTGHLEFVHFGTTAALAAQDFEYAGFVEAGSQPMQLMGQPATALALTRDGREAVFYAFAYGPEVQVSWYAYRVVTMSIIYVVAPKSCPVTRKECFEALFKGDASTGWSY